MHFEYDPSVWNVLRLHRVDFGLDESQEKKSHGVKSGDRGGQCIVGKLRPIQRPPKFSLIQSRTSLAKCGGAPSWMNSFFEDIKDRNRNAFGHVAVKMRQKTLLEYRNRLEPIQKNEGGNIEHYNS
uniref:Uncharacterized protein n=1 Tax=Plectus sambesii TaxID=2011161 RepID=A0A914VU85_9BILA